MAAPYVSGAAALIWDFSSWLNYQQVKNKIIISLDELPSLSGKCVSGGRLNVHKALIPKEPSNLDAAPRAWTEIKLWWQDNSDDEQGFNIYRKYGPYDFSKIATVGENVTTYRNNTCTAGTIYYYYVTAYKSTAESLASNTVSATIPTGPPDAPEPLDARFINGEVWLTWSDSSVNEQGFKIERKSEWDPFWEEIGEVGQNETEFWDHRGLEPDTWYYYRLRAYNPYGYSPYSAPLLEVYVEWELR